MIANSEQKAQIKSIPAGTYEWREYNFAHRTTPASCQPNCKFIATEYACQNYIKLKYKI